MRQSDLLVLFFCFCTCVLQGVVGQQQVGHAAQVQVTLNGVSAQYLVIAQPQRVPQLFKQHLDLPVIIPPKLTVYHASVLFVVSVPIQQDRVLV